MLTRAWARRAHRMPRRARGLSPWALYESDRAHRPRPTLDRRGDAIPPCPSCWPGSGARMLTTPRPRPCTERFPQDWSTPCCPARRQRTALPGCDALPAQPGFACTATQAGGTDALR